jgi:hypothetical protein
MANIANLVFLDYQPHLGQVYQVPNASATQRVLRPEPFKAKPTQAPE